MQEESWFKIVPETACPVCNCRLNAVTDRAQTKTELPVEGDLTLCVECYTPMCFNKDLTLRLMTAEEKSEFSDLINEMISEIVILKRDFR